jgi:hypothetical protein
MHMHIRCTLPNDGFRRGGGGGGDRETENRNEGVSQSTLSFSTDGCALLMALLYIDVGSGVSAIAYIRRARERAQLVFKHKSGRGWWITDGCGRRRCIGLAMSMLVGGPAMHVSMHRQCVHGTFAKVWSLLPSHNKSRPTARESKEVGRSSAGLTIHRRVGQLPLVAEDLRLPCIGFGPLGIARRFKVLVPAESVVPRAKPSKSDIAC